jgi:hypothetical protein
METTSTQAKKHLGSCHCGALRFAVVVDATKGSRCNCTVCMKIGATTTIAAPSALEVLSDESTHGTYEWGWKSGKRFFCKSCGVHAYSRGHLEQLGGDYVSINLNALDDVDLRDVSVTYWDGRHDNWQAGARETPWPVFDVA